MGVARRVRRLIYLLPWPHLKFAIGKIVEFYHIHFHISHRSPWVHTCGLKSFDFNPAHALLGAQVAKNQILG